MVSVRLRFQTGKVSYFALFFELLESISETEGGGRGGEGSDGSQSLEREGGIGRRVADSDLGFWGVEEADARFESNRH